MPYSPPDSKSVSSDELHERARATNLVGRERKSDIVALFYTLSLGFAAGSDRSLQAFLERYVEIADCDDLSYAAFHEWFEPEFGALLREILNDAIENLNPGKTRSEDVSSAFNTFSSSTKRSSRYTKTLQTSTSTIVRSILARNSTSLNRSQPAFQRGGEQPTERWTNGVSYPPANG